MGVCPCCGQEVAGVDREVVFRYPDAVVGLDDAARSRIYVEAGKDFGAMPGRAFVRGLLPVRLTDGHEFRFGVWLEVSEEIGAMIWRAWELAEYRDLRFEAELANAVPPWGQEVLGAPCQVVVRAQDQLPFIQSSSAAVLGRVLTEPWNRKECEDLVAAVWGDVTTTSDPGG